MTGVAMTYIGTTGIDSLKPGPRLRAWLATSLAMVAVVSLAELLTRVTWIGWASGGVFVVLMTVAGYAGSEFRIHHKPKDQADAWR